MSRLSGRLLLLCASLLVTLLLCEVALRLLGLDYNPTPNWHYHPDLGWIHNPGHRYEYDLNGERVVVSFNREGYRDLDRSVAKPPGVRRIVLIGDSFAAALEVNREESFAWRLSELLNERGVGAWEVINLGVGDYGSAQELLTLEQIGLRYAPDVVVHQIFPLNDICNNAFALAGLCMSRKDRYRPYYVESGGVLELAAAQPVRGFLRRRLRTYRLLERVVLTRIEGTAPSVPRDEYARQLAAAGLPPPGPLLSAYLESEAQIESVAQGWRMTERLVERIAEVSREAGAVYLPVVIPFHMRVGAQWGRLVASEPQASMSRDYPEHRLHRLFGRLGVDGVMMRPHFERRPDLFAPPRAGHLNPWGHERTAHALYDALVAQGVVEEARQVEGPLLGARHEAPTYEWGETLDFSAGGNAWRLMASGWGTPERDATWTRGDRAALVLSGDVPRWGLLMKASLEPYLVSGKVERQRVRVHVDGTQVEEWELTDQGFQERTVLLEPRFLVRSDGFLLEIETPDAVAPAGVGAGADSRRRGVAVASMSFSVRAGDARLIADPNPILVCDGSVVGLTTLSWEIDPGISVEVRIGAPDGALFARRGESGHKTTGHWVRDGTRFYLQDVSGGAPLTLANTLATVYVVLGGDGCDSPDAGKAERSADPLSPG